MKASLKNTSQIKFFSKKSTGKLCEGLELEELHCHCKLYSCKRTLVSKQLVESYHLVRSKYGKSIDIRSGFRCQKWNYEVGGVGDSRHKLGLAIDLAPVDPLDLDRLEEIANQYFDVVLRYDDFIHCHNNEEGLEL